MGYSIVSVMALLLLQCAMEVELSSIENPLDIGLVNSCVPSQSSVCLTSYLVPEPVASMSGIIDAHIEGKHNRLSPSLPEEECSDILMGSLCEERYPICNQEEGTVNAMVHQNCTQVLGVCSFDDYCNFTISNASLHQCMTIAELTEKSGYVFKRCSNLPTWGTDYVTEWMFSYLVEIDKDLETFFNAFPNGISEKCQMSYLEFRCGSVGRCWDNGNRVELVQNESDCLALKESDCFSSSVSQIVMPELACGYWPAGTQLPTVTTPIVQLEPNNTTPSSSSSSLSSSQHPSTATTAMTESLLPTTDPTNQTQIPSPADAVAVSAIVLVIFVLLTISLTSVL